LIDSKLVWTFAAPLLGREVGSVLDIGQQIYNNKGKSPLFAEKILSTFNGLLPTFLFACLKMFFKRFKDRSKEFLFGQQSVKS